ncbi:MAG: IS21 family transposase [Dehalococcoidia bacterium]|nr:IS21 family transposase [Dehalococcoidia bacterium]
MARRSFTVRDIVEILRHWHTGRSARQIAKSLGVGRNTVAKFIAVAEAAGYHQGQPECSPTEWSEFVCTNFPNHADKQHQPPIFAQIIPFHDEIVEGLKANHPSTVWQRLHDEQHLPGSLPTFYRYLRHTWPEGYQPIAITVLRDDPPPGEEAQIDFGYLGYWLDPQTGHHRRLWAFLLVLAHSRHMFLRVVHHLDQLSWLECHTAAFAFLGGVPQRLVIDNLTSGVLKPDLYDPAINRGYQQLADHYGTLIDPCRVAHPRDKPRVERMVPYARDSFWAGRNFLSLEEINAAAAIWCMEVAGRRIHGTTRQRPLVVFESVESFALQALPTEPFESASWEKPTVHPDCHAHAAGALYSIPYRYVGYDLDARITANRVEFYLNQERVKSHQRVPKGKRQTDWTDYPPQKAAFFQHNPAWCRQQAAKLGPEVAVAVASLLSTHALHFLRQSQGLIRLADKYGSDRLDAACARANAFGDPSYRTVRNILEKGLEARTKTRLPDLIHISTLRPRLWAKRA